MGKILKIILILIISIISCDTFKIRKVNNCLKSFHHGGPYKVLVYSTTDLEILDLESGDKKWLPNDNTWNEIACVPLKNASVSITN